MPQIFINFVLLVIKETVVAILAAVLVKWIFGND